MAFKPAPLTLQEMLADAQAKLHLLKTGRMSVEVEVEGRRVRYQRVDIDKLEGYVTALTEQITGVSAPTGAITFVF